MCTDTDECSAVRRLREALDLKERELAAYREILPGKKFCLDGRLEDIEGTEERR